MTEGPTAKSFDIVIVGAGMAGASLAAELAPHASVLVIEAEERPGFHATGRSAAFWVASYGGPLVLPLTVASGPYLAEHGFLIDRGGLNIARDNQRADLDRFEKLYSDEGIRLERWDRARMEARVPGLLPAWVDAVMEPALEAMRETARRLEIHLLENDTVVVDGVEFVGCTAWTDFRLHERPGRPVTMSAADAMAGARRVMLDYRLIDVRDAARPAGLRRFEPTDSVVLHERSRSWLAEALARPADRPRVVVTHHLPSWHSVSPGYVAAPSNPAFASDLDALFAGVDLWIHGHTHSSHDYLAAGCRVVCNPRGYPMRAGGFENPRFDPGRTVVV